MKPPLRPPPFHRTVAALSVGQIVCWAVLYYAFTAFVLPMQQEMGWSKAMLMGAYTVGLAVSALLGFAVGAAIDGGRGRAVLVAGPLLGALGLVAWATSHSELQLYAAWVVLGGAMAMSLYEPTFTVVTRMYPERFRQGVTTITLVGGFASTLCFPLVAWLQAQWGWRMSVMALSLPLVAVAALHAWALPRADLTSDAPDSPLHRRPGSDLATSATDATLHEAFTGRAFWALTLTFTTYSFVAGVVWAHIAPALAAKGLSNTDALIVLMCIGPAQVAGRLLSVLTARRLGLRELGLVTLAGLPVACVLFAQGTDLLALLAFALLFGMANGMATIVRGGLLPDYFGRAAIGRIAGAMSGVAQFARAFAPLAGAGLLGVLAGYRELVLSLACLAAAGWLAFYAAGRPARGGRG